MDLFFPMQVLIFKAIHIMKCKYNSYLNHQSKAGLLQHGKMTEKEDLKLRRRSYSLSFLLEALHL